MSGRQYAYMVLDFFRTDSGLCKAYTVENLMSVKWLGDDKADECLGQWDRIISNFLPSQLEAVEQQKGRDAGIKQELFAVQVNLSKIPTIQHAYCEYLIGKKEEEGSQKFTYEFLRKAVEAAVDRRQLSKQQEAERRELAKMAQGNGGDRGNRLAPVIDGKGGADRGREEVPKNPLTAQRR